MIQEFSALFVHYTDLRNANILRVVPSSDPNVPKRPMPTSHLTTPWRIVDLESCMKHNMPMLVHMKNRQQENLDAFWEVLGA